MKCNLPSFLWVAIGGIYEYVGKYLGVRGQHKRLHHRYRTNKK